MHVISNSRLGLSINEDLEMRLKSVGRPDLIIRLLPCDKGFDRPYPYEKLKVGYQKGIQAADIVRPEKTANGS